ncbi:MAG: 50S ribosomal protein L10 [Anaerolineae bacterium]|nr:50S ribosomal protein L10 [Anaerolineae bacterium]
MAISRARKEDLLAVYRQQMTDSSGVIMADYTALNVQRVESLRRMAREKNGQVFVVKNTLFKQVVEETGVSVPDDLLTGPTIVAFCHEDVPSQAKVFRDFAKESEEGRFTVKGALMEGHILSAAEAVAAADLPTREEALGIVLRTINAPASQTVGVVASGIRQVMNVIKAYADKLEETAGAPAAA